MRLYLLLKLLVGSFNIFSAQLHIFAFNQYVFFFNQCKVLQYDDYGVNGYEYKQMKVKKILVVCTMNRTFKQQLRSKHAWQNPKRIAEEVL